MITYRVQQMWWIPVWAEQLPGENSDPEENQQRINSITIQYIRQNLHSFVYINYNLLEEKNGAKCIYEFSIDHKNAYQPKSKIFWTVLANSARLVNLSNHWNSKACLTIHDAPSHHSLYHIYFQFLMWEGARVMLHLPTKNTAKDCVLQFPYSLNKNGSTLFCTPYNIVVNTNGSQWLTNIFNTAKNQFDKTIHIPDLLVQTLSTLR